MFQCVVRNFLAAEEIKITVQGFTVVRGASSNGKSSTLKAVVAACTNTFSPSQVRWGTDSATIKMRFAPNEPVLEVIRSKKGSPLMKFNGVEYSRMARSVPKEIEEYINFGVLLIGQDKYYLNFFTQFQPPLLHAYSQRRIAEILSASPALDDYTVVYKALNSRREQLKGAFNHVDTLLTASKERLSGLGQKLRVLEPLQKSLQEVYSEFVGQVSRREKLIELLRSRRGRDFLSFRVQKRKELLSGYQGYQELNRRSRGLILLQKQCSEWRGLSQRRTGLEKKLEALQELSRVTAIHKNLLNLRESHKSLVKSRERVKACEARIRVYRDLKVKVEVVDELRAMRDRLKHLQSLKSLLELLRSRIGMNKIRVEEGKCPFCGSKIV